MAPGVAGHPKLGGRLVEMLQWAEFAQSEYGKAFVHSLAERFTDHANEVNPNTTHNSRACVSKMYIPVPPLLFKVFQTCF
jgi:hypothetical protein